MLYEAAWGNRVLAEQKSKRAATKSSRTCGKSSATRWPRRRRSVASLLRAAAGSAAEDGAVQPAEKRPQTLSGPLSTRSPICRSTPMPASSWPSCWASATNTTRPIKLLRDALDKEPSPELTDKIRLRLGDCLLPRATPKRRWRSSSRRRANPKSSACSAQANYRAGECLLHMGEPAEAVKRLAVFRDQGPVPESARSDRSRPACVWAMPWPTQTMGRRAGRPTNRWSIASATVPGSTRPATAWAGRYQNQKQFDDAVNAYNQVSTTCRRSWRPRRS